MYARQLLPSRAHPRRRYPVRELASGIVAIHLPGSTALKWSGWLMLAGIVLFSGSLYVLALTGARSLGAVTPFGGAAFIAGWVLLALAVARAG